METQIMMNCKRIGWIVIDCSLIRHRPMPISQWHHAGQQQRHAALRAGLQTLTVFRRSACSQHRHGRHTHSQSRSTTCMQKALAHPHGSRRRRTPRWRPWPFAFGLLSRPDAKIRHMHKPQYLAHLMACLRCLQIMSVMSHFLQFSTDKQMLFFKCLICRWT